MGRPGLNGHATAWMVDCHSHVLPSGDDGATNIEEGRALCVEAARRSTAVLFATPHVWPHLILTPERETAIRSAFQELRTRASLELRLGFELTPSPLLLREDPARYELEGTGCVLVEVPFTGGIDLLIEVAKHIEANGLRPVIAPSRAERGRRGGPARRAPARGARLGAAAQRDLGDRPSRPGDRAARLEPARQGLRLARRGPMATAGHGRRCSTGRGAWCTSATATARRTCSTARRSATVRPAQLRRVAGLALVT